MATTKKAPEKKEPKEYVEYHDGFALVTLSRPMNVGGAPVTKLKMREPSVADSLAHEDMGGTESRKESITFGNLCELSPEQIGALPLRDYRRLGAAFEGFID